jgi:hypothetical protein
MTRAAKVFLLHAAVGFLLAVVLGLLDRMTNIDGVDWMPYVWPTFFMLGGVSGHATLGTLVMVISLSAFLNGVLYGVLGWLCYQIWRVVTPHTDSR